MELKNYILNLKEKNEKGVKKSNQGGWHSPMFDILNDKLVKKFTKIFQNYVKESVEEIGWNYDSNRVKIFNAILYWVYLIILCFFICCSQSSFTINYY